MTETTKEKLRKAFKGKKLTSKQLKNRYKQVIQMTMDGIEIRRFPSVQEASRVTGVDETGISVCANGKNEYTRRGGKSKWKYVK